METGNNTASEPANQLPRAIPTWEWGHLDYARSEGDACRPNTHAEQAAAQDPYLWISRITIGERITLGVCMRWALTSHSRHLEDGTRTLSDVAFGHLAQPHASPTTRPTRWHYVASRLMAHMGTYGPDEVNGLHWLWHQRAALCIRAAMQRHNIWAIPGAPGCQGHASGHRRPPSRGKRHVMTPRDATRGHHLVWVSPPAHTEAPSGHSHRGGTALMPRG